MSDEETNTLHAAIVAMYGADATRAPAASAWLADFQKTMGAWTACDRLLSERRDPVSVCFAAQTLRQKILKSLRELPKESLMSLRDSLIQHLSNVHVSHYDHLADVTMTQLCLAIADLYIQVHEWTNWLSELLNRFTSMDGDRTRMLLVLLRVFPEEIETIAVGENRRRIVREEIAASAPSALQFLHFVMEKHGHTADEDFIKKVISCLAAYLTNPEMPTDELASSQLLATVFAILTAKAGTVSSVLHGTATDCVVNALFRAEDTSKNEALAHALHRGVMALRVPYLQAVHDEDLDRLQNFGRIFVELVESMLEFIVNGPSKGTEDLASLEALDLLLVLADHHDYSLIEMSFHIWYRLSEALFQIDSDEQVARFAPHVTRYLQALYKHVRYDTDMEGLPASGCELAEFREKAAESVKDVVYIVGTDTCVRMMFETMAACVARGGTWDETEAALFITSHVIHNLLPEEASIVPELMAALFSLPTSSTHPALLLTCADLLREAAEWLQKHAEYQEGALKWLAELVVQPQFASAAGDAIASICAKCAGSLAEAGAVPRLLSLVPILEATQSNAKGVEAGISHILRGATICLMCMREAEMTDQLNEIGRQICGQFTEALQHVKNGGGTGVGTNGSEENVENEKDAWRKIAREPLLWIDRVSSVFREVLPWFAQEHGDRPAPWLELAHTLWIPLSEAFILYQQNSRVVEHICRAVRFLVRSLGVQSQGFVVPLVTQMVDIYQSNPHSCILYLSSILVDEYGTMAEIRPGLLSMMETLLNRAFVDLLKPNGIRDNPDTVDDLFRLACRFVLRCPSPFFEHPMSGALLDCAIAALSVEHVDANRSTTRFVCQSIEQLLGARTAKYNDAGVEALEKTVREKGPKLTEHALRAGLFDLSSHLRREQADILYLLKKADKEHFALWLREALSSFPSTPPCATLEQAKAFYDTILQQTESREIYVLMRDFARLYA